MRDLKRYLVFVLAASLLLAAGCRRPEAVEPGEEIAHGGIIFEGSIADAQTFNPIYIADTASSRIAHFIFNNSLLTWNRDVELILQSAERYDVTPDEKEYTFYLHQGITWHDGQPFTAHDVVFTYESFMNPFYTGPRRGDMAPLLGYKDYTGKLSAIKKQLTDKEITSETHDALVTEAFEAWKKVGAVQALGDYTVKFTLETAMSTFLTRTAGYSIIPKHILGDVHGRDVKDHAFSRNPVGTGPFKWKEWKPDEYIAVVRNPDWWGGPDGKEPPNVDQIVTKCIPDQKTLEIALEAKELDVGGVTPEEFDRFAAMPHLRLYETSIFSYTYMGFRIANPLFEDKRVRQAISYAINKEEMVEELYRGHGTVAWTHGSPARWDYNPDVKTYPYDPTKAKEMLAEAGWKAGPDGILEKDGLKFKFTLQTNLGNRIREQAAVVIQENLRAIGIEIEIKLVEWATFVDKVLLAHQFEAMIVGWSLGVDPDSYTIWHTNGGVYNFGPYSNPRVDELLDEGRIVADLEKRKVIYQEIQAILAEDQPYVFLFYPNSITGVGNRIRGEILPTPLDRGVLFYAEELWIPTEQQAGPNLN